MQPARNDGGDVLVLEDQQPGMSVIPQPTPLTRLNYFDGKFLRADDCALEQRWVGSLVGLSNQAGGAGVVYGFDTVLDGGGANVRIGRGLAIDGTGRVLFLPAEVSLAVDRLVAKSQPSPSAETSAALGSAAFTDCVLAAPAAPDAVPRAPELYVIAIVHAEALCGQEDVYGKLCEEACVTSANRPYRVEGVIVLALPLVLDLPQPAAGQPADLVTLRSRVASAFFARERTRVPSHVSGAGLTELVWCLGAVLPPPGIDPPPDAVPLAVVARANGTTRFLDPWIVRRERIEPPPRRWWAGVMAMRPWDVYLAQILQFQCHLREALAGAPEPGAPQDPCAHLGLALQDTATYFKALPRDTLPEDRLAELVAIERRVTTALEQVYTGPTDDLLVRRGILELPPAGYLPLTGGLKTDRTVNDQVRALLGPGVDLLFCIVRPDHMGHAIEEVQHMDRISLVAGRVPEARKPVVEILIPIPDAVPPPGTAERDGELVVPPVPDWVVFRRHRPETCAVAAEVPPRRYWLRHVAITGEDDLKRLREALSQGVDPAQLELEIDDVGVVEFAAGLATVLNAAAVAQLWSGLVPAAAPLRYQAIATVGRDDDAVEIPRLHELDAALPVADAANALVDRFDEIPPGLGHADVDGMILLATELRTACHTVYRLDPLSMELIQRMLDAGGVQAVLDGQTPNGGPLATLVATVTFTGDATAVTGRQVGPLAQGWNNAGDGRPASAIVLTPTPADVEKQRGQAIAETLGARVGTEIRVSRMDVPGDCAVTLLRPATVCHEVWAVKGTAADAAKLFARKDLTKLDSLANAVGHFAFLADSNVLLDFDPKPPQQVQADQWHIRYAGEEPAEDTQGQPFRDQLHRIASMLHVEGFVAENAEIRGNATLPPESCPFVHLLRLKG